jgi:hypothetical protein
LTNKIILWKTPEKNNISEVTTLAVIVKPMKRDFVVAKNKADLTIISLKITCSRHDKAKNIC